MANKNIYLNVQVQLADFILYRDEKTPTHQEPLTPFRAFIFKWAKPTGPQQQTLRFWEKQKHVWNLKKEKNSVIICRLQVTSEGLGKLSH